MDGKVKACTSRTRMCWLFHEKKNSSIAVNSFFKVMIGDKFSKILVLPPKFAPEVSALVGQKAFLEDSSGWQWEVTMSKVNGFLAFQQGWSNFALDHDLKLGDFVLFFPITESHFVVKIYDTTACEKVMFPGRNDQSERMKDSRSSTEKDGLHCTNDTSLKDKHGSVNSTMPGSDAENGDGLDEANDVMEVPILSENISSPDNMNKKSEPLCKVDYSEEIFYMTNRNLGEEQGEDRKCNFDLSAFEMCNNSSFPLRVDSSLRSQNDACLICKDQVDKEVASGAVPLDAFDCKKDESDSDKDSCIVSTFGHLLTKSVVNQEENGVNASEMSNRVKKECQIAKENDQEQISRKHSLNKDKHQSSKRKFGETSSIPTSIETKTCHSDKMMKGIKQDSIKIKSESCSQEIIQKLHGGSSEVTKGKLPCSASMGARKDNRVHPVVKTEIVDLVESSSIDSPNFSSLLATSSQSFIELPEYLPFPIAFGRVDGERKVVRLRGPTGELWPVMYHEKPSLIVLTTGWEAFSKANGIRSGNLCRFVIENESQGIYSVSVVGK